VPTTQTIQLGEAIDHRGITIAPLFPRESPRAAHLTLDQALHLGLRIEEVGASGSVPELLVVNPTNQRVLLFDGEELVGAKQDRIVNVTVLVDASSSVSIPVSCVEQGRWSARTDSFSAAPHAAHPELRRRKAESLRVAPMELGSAQGEVWAEVRGKLDRLGAPSHTGAQRDAYVARRADLSALESAFPLSPGQSGAIVGIGGRVVALDAVSQPSAFEVPYPKLLAGYLLDAIECLDVPLTTYASLEGFLAETERATVVKQSSVGLGNDLRLSGDGVVGSGLEFDGERLQLSAFRSEGRRTRIARPKHRM
jgi:hypothetical protein